MPDFPTKSKIRGDIEVVFYETRFLRRKIFKNPERSKDRNKLFFRSEPGSCLVILENGLETDLTLLAKTLFNDSFGSELSFRTKISMRNQFF